MSIAKPVPDTNAFVQAPDFATGGSHKVDDRRREALREWLPMLLDRIHRAGERGLSVQQASKDTGGVPGFQQALKNQRATLLQFAQLWPDEIRIEKRGTQNIMYAVGAAPRPQEPDAAAAAPRPQEPPETREERNARLDARLAEIRAKEDAAKERSRAEQGARLAALRASRPQTPADFRWLETAGAADACARISRS